jgi:hypothetical protein
MREIKTQNFFPTGEPQCNGEGFPSTGHRRIARIDWTISQVVFIWAVSVPVGEAHTRRHLSRRLSLAKGDQWRWG